MEISMKTISLFGSVILTGLSAGLFYAWSVSVIPGTQKITDAAYLESMQSINREILNPTFFFVFFGSIVLQIVASVYQFQFDPGAFWLMLLAAIIYLVGTMGVTGLGNVPLNEQLEGIQLHQLSNSQLADFREYYESRWNKFHLIRTICTVISFLFATASTFSMIKFIK